MLSHVWPFATPWTVASQAPLSMGFSRQEYWNELQCSPPGDLPNPGIKPSLPHFRQILYCLSHQGSIQFSSVQLLSCVRLFVTPWIAARQASLSITNSWSLLKLMSIESVIPSNHLILCRCLLLLLLIFKHISLFNLIDSCSFSLVFF